jgi:hypothetical protein
MSVPYFMRFDKRLELVLVRTVSIVSLNAHICE